MRRTRRLAWAVAAALAALPVVGVRAEDGRPAEVGPGEPRSGEPLCGELTKVGEIRVLRVWGTSKQRGYAHGYLLAEDLKRLFEAFLADKRFSGGAKTYNTIAMPMAAAMMSPKPIYQKEMEGIVEGMRARLGEEGIFIGALGRPLEYRDVLAVNCLSDRVGPMCSSFAVWGPMTKDGATLTARNLDWPRHDWMLGNEVLLVELPSEKPNRAGWASMTWPGFVGCLSGMNEHGVTAAMHDVHCGAPDGLMGFVPRGLVLREAMETAHNPDAIGMIAAALIKRHIAVATNIFVSEPWRKGADPPAAVLEYDTHQSDEGGVTLRGPGKSPAAAESFTACTNHFRKRGPEGGYRCSRYATLLDKLTADSEEGLRLSVDDVWRIAASVNVPGDDENPILTYHTIVFEPNVRRMHVAVASGTEPAGKRRPTAIELKSLLVKPEAKAAVGSAGHLAARRRGHGTIPPQRWLRSTSTRCARHFALPSARVGCARRWGACFGGSTRTSLRSIKSAFGWRRGRLSGFSGRTGRARRRR